MEADPNTELILKKKYIRRNCPKFDTKQEVHKWYMDNVDDYRIASYNFSKTKTLCECGCLVSNRNIAVHRQSYKHDVLMLKLDNIHTNTLATQFQTV